MLTTRHPVDFPYTRPELDALFQYARDHDVEKGGRYDARSACIILLFGPWPLLAAARFEGLWR
jgi:hypothetical protein